MSPGPSTVSSNAASANSGKRSASTAAPKFRNARPEKRRCFELQDEMFAFLNTTGAVTKRALQETWAALAMPSEGTRKKVVVKYFAKRVVPLPQASEAAAMWAKQGVPDAHQAMLRAELEKTLIVDRADSQTREQVLKTGGYFPTDLKCSRAEK